MTLEPKYCLYDEFKTKILSMMTLEQNIVYDDFRTKILSMMTLEPKYCL